MRLLLPAVAVIVSLLPSSVRGQSAADVSKEVMNALLRGPGVALGDNFALQTALPSGFPKELLPSGAEVGVVGVSDRATAVVMIAPTLTEASRLSETTRIGALGWTNTSPMSGIAFASTPVMSSLVFCRATEFAYVGFVPRSSGGSLVRVAVAKEPGRACIGRPTTAMSDVNVPQMTPPDGVKSSGGGGGGGTDSYWSGARLQGDRSVAEIEAHYQKQLVAAGWKVEGRRLDGTDLSVLRLSSMSMQGEPVTGLLIVTGFPNLTMVDVMFRIIRNRPTTQPLPMNVPPPGTIPPSLPR